MNLNSRVTALEIESPEPPAVIYLGGTGGAEFPNESREQALSRCGIHPDTNQTLIFVEYTKEPVDETCH